MYPTPFHSIKSKNHVASSTALTLSVQLISQMLFTIGKEAYVKKDGEAAGRQQYTQQLRRPL
jgi:hypothetical protein